MAMIVATVALFLYFVKVLMPYAAPAFATINTFALALPLGLSFLALRWLDLAFVVRSRALPAPGLGEYLSFMLYPAVLAAGPLMTLADFRKSRITDYSIVDYGAGVARCGVGVAKKLMADAWIAPIIAASYESFIREPGAATAALVLPMLLCNLAYIYLDFSAYADLATGTARAMGRRVPENFDWPLLRSSLRSYWQHWHMTLSNWAMRRVYFPSFVETRSTALATTAAMLTIGLWHFPDLGWTLWAFHHAVGLIANAAIDKTTGGIAMRDVTRVVVGLLGWSTTVAWVALGYAFTLFDNVSLTLAVFRALLRIA
jgi:alginate O-acetyltransferase complex protein AlgI